MSRTEFDSLETERLVLRRFKEEDAETFQKYRTDPRIFIYQGEGWENYTLDKSRQFIEEQMNNEPGTPDTWFQIAIELKESGELIGDCAMHTLPDTNQVEIGFTLSPEYQGKGYAIEAVGRLLDYILLQLDKHRVIAVADVRNTGSVKLLERIGMRREGHFIKNCWYRGEYTDEYLYAILSEEWRKRING